MKVVKTTFEEEQKQKDEAFLKLTPLQRWEYAFKVRQKMYKPDVHYSFSGQKVTVKKLT
jgi:hypothetical protein